MKNYAYYDLTTGEFKRSISTTMPSFVESNAPPNCGWVEGEFDKLSQKVDLETLQVVDFIPPAPADTELLTFAWSTTEKRWMPQRTFAAKQLAKWEEMKARRAEVEFGSFVWDGSTFDSDPTSTSRIMGAFSLAMAAAGAGAPYEIEWTLADNTKRVLSAADMIAVGMTLGTAVATAHGTASSLRAAIDAATTTAQLEAISWPS